MIVMICVGFVFLMNFLYVRSDKLIDLIGSFIDCFR